MCMCIYIYIYIDIYIYMGGMVLSFNNNSTRCVLVRVQSLGFRGHIV